MRPFIAIGFDKQTNDAIYKIMQELEGHYTAKRKNKAEMLHITLHFFGDCPNFDLDTAIKTCDYIAEYARPFELETDIPKIFGKADNAVLYLSLGKNVNKLERFQDFIEGTMPRFGFEKEGRDYHPHITFAREAVIPDMNKLIEIAAKSDKISFKAENLVLLNSQKVDGEATYVELYRTKLTY